MFLFYYKNCFTLPINSFDSFKQPGRNSQASEFNGRVGSKREPLDWSESTRARVVKEDEHYDLYDFGDDDNQAISQYSVEVLE